MKILPFKDHHQPMVDEMLVRIQQEFEQPFTSSQSRKMIEANKVRGSRFWVLMDGDRLAGTVGVIKMKQATCALKSLFIPLEYRGSGAAKLLLEQVIRFAQNQKMNSIYLGTMDQMKGAQKFYVKSGFVQVNEKDLPNDFPANVLDTVFYKLALLRDGQSSVSA